MLRTRISILGLVALTVVGPSSFSNSMSRQHPNVIIIITDDQGYGDLGFTGNPHVKTPVIDKFANESIRFNKFYVSPVCAPTRASLMTGRYSLRTGVRDTYNGGSIMSPDEITIAEMLKEIDYQTGIFGKWHLGDSYPSRPGDQGFDESLIHLAGGMGQPGDFTTFFEGDSSYFDPVLWYNGKQKSYQGYCSDIFTDNAIRFIEKYHQKPFFCYLSFNAPHTPLQVPGKYYNMYKDIDPASGFENDPRPFPKMSIKNKEDARKVYAMMSNIDDNVGKLLEKLNELNISENTLVIFMSDNGPAQPRYNGGMRERKSSVYRGGIRVPFYWRLPARFEGNKDIESTLAHIDLLPTISELCNFELPTDRVFDGKSFLPILNGKAVDEFDKRTLFFYWTRRYPQLYKNIAMQKGPYKLVGNSGYDSELEKFELFNIQKDEFEKNNIISSNKTIAAELKTEMDQIIHEITSSTHVRNPVRTIIGSRHENPVYLNRNDASGEPGVWKQEEVFGLWKVKIHEGRYNIRFKFIKPVENKGTMYLETNSVIIHRKNSVTPADFIEMKDVYLPEMECDFTPYYQSNQKSIFPLWVEIEKIN